MYTLVQDVEVVRKLELNDVVYVTVGRIAESSALQSHALPVRAI